MQSTTVAVDLAKSVFQLAVANVDRHVTEQHRLTRTQFERWFANRDVSLVLMEGCGSAPHRARAGPTAWVSRSRSSRPPIAWLRQTQQDRFGGTMRRYLAMKVKSIEQRALQGLHRTRSLWMGTRTSRTNALRGFCRKFAISVAAGSRNGPAQISRVLTDPHSAVPVLTRGTMKLLVDEIRQPEAPIAQLKHELTELARQSPACTTLLSIPGIGLLTSTASALWAAAFWVVE